MIPYSSFFMTMKKPKVPKKLRVYMYNSAAIRGLPSCWISTADAISAIREYQRIDLPKGYDIRMGKVFPHDEFQFEGNERLYVF